MLDQWWGVVEKLWRCWQREMWTFFAYKKYNTKKNAKCWAAKRNATNSSGQEKRRKES